MYNSRINLQSRTKKFALRIIKLFDEFPSNDEFRIYMNQLIRSATSVGANTRAAFRSRSKKEFISKIGIVIEEADESAYWLELINDRINKQKEEIIELIAEADELVSIFISVSKKMKAKR